MISWKEKALFALALALTIAVLCLTLYAQGLRIDQANQKREAAEGKVTQLTGERDQLTDTLTEQRAAQVRLQTNQKDLRREIDVRRRRIQELEHENAELKAWAGQPLPAAARRLRQRPVLTGATAYREWLSSGNALPAAVDPPAQ
jgi:LysB family phage lysis regulatory protein